MEFNELKDKIRMHKWRIRFSFLPSKRVVLHGGCVVHDGYYFWRIVIEVNVGVYPDNWVAYAHFNDNVKFSSGV